MHLYIPPAFMVFHHVMRQRGRRPHPQPLCSEERGARLAPSALRSLGAPRVGEVADRPGEVRARANLINKLNTIMAEIVLCD